MEHFVLSRFWTRIWAYLIDVILLGIAGSIILQIGLPFFIKIGGWGRLLGWPIALAYLGIGNSVLAGGQTPGKRLMRIEVVDISGAPISFARSLKRAVVLTAPFFLVGIPFFLNFPLLTLIIQLPLALVSLGVLLYYIFNRETRQSLHDLAAGTYVVEVMRQEYEPVEMLPRTNRPFNIWIGTAVVLIVVGVATGAFLKKQPFVKNLELARARVGALKGVRNVIVSEQTYIYKTPENPTGVNKVRVVSVETGILLYNPKYEAQQQALIRQIAGAYLQTPFPKNAEDNLSIVLMNIADIGIANNTKGVSVPHTIKEWRALLDK